MRTARVLALIAAGCLSAAPLAHAEDPPRAESYLLQGKLAEGEAALAESLKGNPRDAQTRFGLGTIQFVRAVERLAQSFHKYGLRPDPAAGILPLARLPVPANPDPSPIKYDDLRGILQAWTDDLRKVEETLAPLDDPNVKLPLHFARIRLDLDGDGKASDDESLWKLYSRMNRQAQIEPAQVEGFVIAFDRGDVAWLRGYAHLLSTFGEIYLAHDGRDLFERTAHLFFARPETPYGFLRNREPRGGFDSGQISDLIAMVHLVRLPVVEPKRMASVLDHLKATIALSRESWACYMAETDDDREWIPNPKQTGVIPGVKITEEMVKGWTVTFLDEAQEILDGRKLVPFWRDAGGRGVNLRRVFAEPRELDLVLWVQGTSAVPYLEDGELTTPEVWRRLQRIFQGEFLGFALWFN